MKLTDRDIAQFIEAWFRDFGELLSRDRARHEAQLVLELYLLVATKEKKEPIKPSEPRNHLP